MARKKAYSLVNGTAKPRTQSVLNSKGTLDATQEQWIPPKPRESSSASSSNQSVYDVTALRSQLVPYGLTVRDIPGDGNCLFRALCDQLEGHTKNHMKYRRDTVRYIIKNREFFEPFIDVPFEYYVEQLSHTGTYAGQDALVAFAKLHKVNILIHQLNRPMWQIQGCSDVGAPELHLSYHNGEHYSSVRRCGDIENTPAGIRILDKASTVPFCATHSICTSTSPVTSHVHFGPTSIESSFPPTLPTTDTISKDSINEDEFDILVHEAMVQSGCSDRELVTETLLERGCNLELVVDYLVSLSVFMRPLNETKHSNGNMRGLWRKFQDNDLQSDINPTKIKETKSVGKLNSSSIELQPVRQSRVIQTGNENNFEDAEKINGVNGRKIQRFYTL